MNKEQYINELKKELQTLPESERNDAMGYYEELLSDMEEFNTDDMNSLESPSSVAAQIKAETAMRNIETTDTKAKKGLSTVWTVLLGIFALPIGLPVAIAIAVVALALIICALAIILSLFATSVGILLSGIVSLIAGLVLLFMETIVGIFYLGCGLLCIGVGYILTIGIYQLSKVIFKGIAKFINRIRLKQQKKHTEKNEVA